MVETSYFLGLEFPALSIDFSGTTGIGICLSITGNITNGVGYVIQNLGHHKTGSIKCMNRSLRKYDGDEKERLEQVLEDGDIDTSSPVGLDAEKLAKARLAEITKATAGHKQAKASKSSIELDEDLAAGPNPWTNPTWVCGFFTYAIGSLINAMALGFAPAALIAPIDGVTLVTNAALAPMVLPEKLKSRDMLGASVIMIGVALCVLFGPSNEVEWSVEDLVTQWGNAAMIAYTVGMVGSTYMIYKLSQCMMAGLVDSGLFDPNSGEKMDLALPNAVTIGISYCWIAGTLAAYNGLFTSAWTIALVSSFESGTNYYSITPTCVSTAFCQVAAFIMCNFSMEYFKQKAMSSFDSLFIVPVFQVLLVILLVITAGIFYQDFEKMYSGQILVFTIGVLFTCLGVAILAVQTEVNRRDATQMLWDCLDNVEAPWAVHLRQIQSQWHQQAVDGRVSHFVDNLKASVTQSNAHTLEQVEQLRDWNTRDEVIAELSQKDLQDVVRELMHRIDGVVLELQNDRGKQEKIHRSRSAGFSGLAMNQEVRSTPLGTSTWALGHMANERANNTEHRRAQHSHNASIINSLGGPSRANSRANSGKNSNNVSRPRSARPSTAPRPGGISTAVAAAAFGVGATVSPAPREDVEPGVGRGELLLPGCANDAQGGDGSSAIAVQGGVLDLIPESKQLEPSPASEALPVDSPHAATSLPDLTHMDVDASAPFAPVLAPGPAPAISPTGLGQRPVLPPIESTPDKDCQ